MLDRTWKPKKECPAWFATEMNVGCTHPHGVIMVTSTKGEEKIVLYHLGSDILVDMKDKNFIANNSGLEFNESANTLTLVGGEHDK